MKTHETITVYFGGFHSSDGKERGSDGKEESTDGGRHVKSKISDNGAMPFGDRYLIETEQQAA